MFSPRLSIVLLVALASTWAGASLNTDAKHLKVAFEKFEHDFGKKYVNQAERIRRFTIFAENVKKIEKHNAEGHTWTKGINQFTDLTG